MNKEPDFKVNTDNLNGNKDISNTGFAESFSVKLLGAFKSGVGDLLEAKRLVNSQHLAKDLDLLLNDEEHSWAFKRMSIIDDTDISASDFMKHHE